MGQSVKNTPVRRRLAADLFDPEKFHTRVGDDLKAGQGAIRNSARCRSPPAHVAIGDELMECLKASSTFARQEPRCTSGGMGARDRTSTTRSVVRLRRRGDRGPGPLPVREKEGRSRGCCPREMVEKTNLVGPVGYIKERLAAYKEAGVTTCRSTRGRRLGRTIEARDCSERAQRVTLRTASTRHVTSCPT